MAVTTTNFCCALDIYQILVATLHAFPTQSCLQLTSVLVFHVYFTEVLKGLNFILLLSCRVKRDSSLYSFYHKNATRHKIRREFWVLTNFRSIILSMYCVSHHNPHVYRGNLQIVEHYIFNYESK